MITLFKDQFFTGLDTKRFLSTPETKIIKTETEYKVSISVPGLTKDDLKITTKEGTLRISFEKEEGDSSRHFIGGFVKCARRFCRCRRTGLSIHFNGIDCVIAAGIARSGYHHIVDRYLSNYRSYYDGGERQD